MCYLLLRITCVEKIYFQNKHLSLNHQYFHLISSINRRIKYLRIGYYCYCESDHSVLLYCVLFPFLYRKEKHFLRNMSKTTKGIATNALLHIWKSNQTFFAKLYVFLPNASKCRNKVFALCHWKYECLYIIIYENVLTHN